MAKKPKPADVFGLRPRLVFGGGTLHITICLGLAGHWFT
jgi:hypothetical protein